jgi:hypothetical protein
MKTKILVTLLIAVHFSGWCQTNMVGKSFVTMVDKVIVFPMNDETGFYFVKKNTKFSITNIDKNNDLVITFWPYKQPKLERTDSALQKASYDRRPEPNTINAYPTMGPAMRGKGGVNVIDYQQATDPESFIGPWADGLSFLLPLSSLNSMTAEYFGKGMAFTWGAMTLPLKLRFKHKESIYGGYEEKLNLGLNVGLKMQIPGRVQRSLNIVSALGVGNVRTDSISMKPGYYISDRISASAVSFDIGCLFESDAFQVGIFLGKDYLPGPLSKQWRYQGKTWLGIAIGVSLFNKSKATSESGENQNTH